MRIDFAELSLGEIYENDLSAIHKRVEFEAIGVLADNVAHHRVVEEGSEFRHEIVEHFAFVEIGSFCHLFGPKIENERIFEVRTLLLFKCSVDKELRDLHQRAAARAGHYREGGITQPMLKLRANDAGFLWIEEFVEDLDADRK